MPQSPRRYKPPVDRIGDGDIQLLLRHISGCNIEQCSLYGCDLVSITVLDILEREDCPVDENGGVLSAEAGRHREMEPRRVGIAQIVDDERRFVRDNSLVVTPQTPEHIAVFIAQWPIG
jgi:hypothetical protein